jgi:hypothetical protein
MVSLGNNKYQCIKYGWVVTVTELPIRCTLCDTPKISREEGSGATPTLPPLTTQAVNFAKAALNHAIGGFRRTSPEEYGRRINICGGCDKFTEGRCSSCGCFLETKTSWEEQHCPDGKW